jgi:hypothetical protein
MTNHLNFNTMKLFTIVAWFSGILAVILMLTGAIALIVGENVLHVRHEANFFIVASSFLLLGILCVLARQGCCCEKKE